MNTMNKSLTGIVAPLTTPFEDEEICLDSFAKNLEKYAATNLAGYLVLGSNGENKSLSDQEKKLVIQAAVNHVPAHQAVIVGIAEESTRIAIRQVEQAAELGADYVSLFTPSYFRSRLTDVAFVRHFLSIADKSPLPVLLYNAPKFTGVTLTPRVIAEVSKHSNIVGMKDTSASTVQYLEACAQGFQVLAGSLEILLPALLLGASGGVVSLANAFPTICCTLFDLVQAGNLEEARPLFMKLYRLNRSISGSYSIAGVKYAMDVAGYYGGPPRLPILPLNQDEKENILRSIQAAELILETS
jgi:4-hydroxy-2-oxoglutarate aldolase